MQSVTASNQKAEVVENTTPFTALTNAGVNVNLHPAQPRDKERILLQT